MRHLNSPITLTNHRRRTQLNGPREWFDGHGYGDGHSGRPKAKRQDAGILNGDYAHYANAFDG